MLDSALITHVDSVQGGVQRATLQLCLCLLGNMQPHPANFKSGSCLESRLLEAEHPKAFLSQRGRLSCRAGLGQAVGRNNFGFFAKINSCATGTGSPVVNSLLCAETRLRAWTYFLSLCGAPPQ